MKDLNVLMSGLEYKLKKLILLQNDIKQENQRLINENIELKNQSSKFENKISELEDKYKFLKISNTIENLKGGKDAKLKINELLREIDKCLSLLNN